ncbi:SWI5-dependent HO expression protein 4, partial [Coemansia sp. RSA 2610]
MLISSQLAAAAKDPRSSANFPGYDVAAGSRSNAPLPPALTQLRAVAASTLDAWVQSTVQAERSRGLLSLAALYESGAGGELAAGVWQKSEWAEELWDQGEFDKPETQLALLTLADACSTDTKLAATMKNLGSGLVQALARKRAGSNALDSQLAEAASVVLAKWTGLSTAAATKSRDSEPKIDGNHDTDADPLELADTHIQRIILRTEQDIADTDVASTVERSVESLGYLCLKPKLKEHVVQNTKLLQALFSAAQKTESMSLKFATIMLIRNLTQYRPVLSEEQKRMQQLQQLNKRAQAGAADANSKRTVGDDIKDGTAQDSEESPMDAPEYVAKRSALVCNAGAIGVLVSATQSKRQASDSMKDAVAETIVSLATSQKLRGLLVQQGAVRALLAVLTRDAPKATTAKDEPYMPRPLLQKRDKDVGFALAKIAISVPPHLAFHDPREIVRLLLSLLAEDTETQALLMKFEALLALTNLASVEPNTANDVRGYMACELNGMSLVEICVLSEHPLVRRAATELICNLVYDPQVFERFVGDADKY